METLPVEVVAAIIERVGNYEEVKRCFGVNRLWNSCKDKLTKLRFSRGNDPSQFNRAIENNLASLRELYVDSDFPLQAVNTKLQKLEVTYALDILDLGSLLIQYKDLEHLKLNRFNFKNPASETCNHLIQLDLSHGQIDTDLESFLGMFPMMKTFRLDYCNFAPKPVENNEGDNIDVKNSLFRNITDLYLGYLWFYEPLDAFVAMFPALKRLNLHNCEYVNSELELRVVSDTLAVFTFNDYKNKTLCVKAPNLQVLDIHEASSDVKLSEVRHLTKLCIHFNEKCPFKAGMLEAVDELVIQGGYSIRVEALESLVNRLRGIIVTKLRIESLGADDYFDLIQLGSLHGLSELEVDKIAYSFFQLDLAKLPSLKKLVLNLGVYTAPCANVLQTLLGAGHAENNQMQMDYPMDYTSLVDEDGWQRFDAEEMWKTYSGDVLEYRNAELNGYTETISQGPMWERACENLQEIVVRYTVNSAAEMADLQSCCQAIQENFRHTVIYLEVEDKTMEEDPMETEDEDD